MSELYHGDCLDVLPTLRAQSVDMVLCDLPYGTTQNKWDSVIPFDRLWAEYRRVCRGAVVLTAAQPFTSALVTSNLRAFKYEWVWCKNKASGHLNAKKRPLQSHESVLVFVETRAVYNPQRSSGHRPANYAKRIGWSPNYGAQRETEYEGGITDRCPTSLLLFPVVNNNSPDRHHPTQKPVELLEYLIRTYTDEGGIVLDNTMGAGSTGVACANTGRKFIGIESDQQYFDVACKRIWGEWLDV